MKSPNTLQSTLLILACLCWFSSYSQTALIKEEQRRLPLLNDSISYVNSLNRIGMLFHMKDPDSCFNYGFKAKAIASRLGYTKGAADADNNIAISLALKGLSGESLALFSEVLQVYKQLRDTVNVTQVYMNMSVNYAGLGDQHKAIAFSRKSILAGKDLKKDSIMALVYGNYSMINPTLPTDSINYYLNKAYQIASRYKDIRTITTISGTRAEMLMATGHREEALSIIKQALSNAHSAGLEYVEAYCLDVYANYFKDEPDSALTYLNREYTLINSTNYVYFKPNVLNRILQCYIQTGNKDKQLSTSILLNSLLSEEKERTKKFIGDYVKYNTLQQDNEQLLTINKTSEKKIWILILVCIVVVFFIIIVYRLYQSSRKHAHEQIILNKQINLQNKSLQQVDEFKNKLISILAHDFRTPLISTIAVAGMMKENHDVSKEEMETFYGSIEKDAQTMLQSFDMILQWIRHQLSGYQYNIESLRLQNLIQEVTTIYNHQLESKKITLKNNISEHILVLSEREMLQFINRNLLSNAIKFSPEYGSITINAVETTTELIISVEDEGTGISEEALNKLFSISGHMSAFTNQGAGIALSMCRDFIEKLGGRIWAENKTTQGAVFFYAIPLT